MVWRWKLSWEGEEGGNRDCRQKGLLGVVDSGLQVLGPWEWVGGGLVAATFSTKRALFRDLQIQVLHQN